ncbi:MAG: hypothetical protein LBN08_07430 [Lactobacillales bacterium]|jgi:hypothetical protein|nr:hypothetical protein [Lactobacillales bacterium]
MDEKKSGCYISCMTAFVILIVLFVVVPAVWFAKTISDPNEQMNNKLYEMGIAIDFKDHRFSPDDSEYVDKSHEDFTGELRGEKIKIRVTYKGHLFFERKIVKIKVIEQPDHQKTKF